MSLLERLNKMHRDLYRKSFSEAMAYGLFPTRHIEAYSKNFDAELPTEANYCELDDLLRAIQENQMILFGDFHTLRQSQRELLRIIRSAFSRPGEECVLALEMVDARHQCYVDAYMKGELSEQEFLSLIDYERRWGFPWKNYKMIFDFAKQNNIYVFAVNHEAQGKKSLQERDQVIARRLHSIVELFPGRKVFCLIGEFHLADSHLPLCLTNENKTHNTKFGVARILSNIDRYYFSLGRGVGNLTTDYIALDKNYYCILNTPPWMKWKSLTMWRENQMTVESDSFLSDDEIADYIDVGFDVDFNFQKILENICSFLKLEDGKELADVAYIHLCTDANDLSRFVMEAKSIRLTFEQVAERCTRDGAFIDDECNIYITNLTINNLANVCGRYIRKRRLGEAEEGEFREADVFAIKVLEYCCGAIARRIMNPSYKAININNFEEYVKAHFRKRLKGFAQDKRDEAKIVLDFHSKMIAKDFSMRTINANILDHKDTVYSNGISKMLGEVLGGRMYTRLLTGKTSIEDIQKLFDAPLITSGEPVDMLEDVYRLSFEKIESVDLQKRPA